MGINEITAVIDRWQIVERGTFACTVFELDLAAGELLMANQQVKLLAGLSEMYVETNDLTKMDGVRVSADQPSA